MHDVCMSRLSCINDKTVSTDKSLYYKRNKTLLDVPLLEHIQPYGGNPSLHITPPCHLLLSVISYNRTPPSWSIPYIIIHNTCYLYTDITVIHQHLPLSLSFCLSLFHSVNFSLFLCLSVTLNSNDECVFASYYDTPC